MAPRTSFPPVRACLLDMDGLLIDTEDQYTECINTVLSRHARPLLPWSLKARLQGRPGVNSTRLLYDWAKLPISYEEYMAEYSAEQQKLFPRTKPLPGAEELLANLLSTRAFGRKEANEGKDEADEGKKGEATLAAAAVAVDGGHRDLFAAFRPNTRLLGDDPRIPAGRGKPHPDIYLAALRAVNESLAEDEEPIRPEECLVFEDAVSGVEAGRRAGMRVVWVPHVGLRAEYEGREAEVLAGRTGEAGDVEMDKVGELNDGWAETLDSLVAFPYDRYGIVIPGRPPREASYMDQNA